MSRIDKLLLSEGIIDIWNVVSQKIRSKDISGHIQIWLKCNVTNLDPKPFRTLNSWFDHPYLYLLWKKVYFY